MAASCIQRILLSDQSSWSWLGSSCLGILTSAYPVSQADSQEMMPVNSRRLGANGDTARPPVAVHLVTLHEATELELN